MQSQVAMLKVLYAISVLAGVAYTSTLSAVEEYDKEDYHEQLYGEVGMLEFGEDESRREIVYKVQAGTGQYLYLGPNESFFAPVGQLTLTGEEISKELELNGGKEYKTIKGLTRKGDQIEWGFITQTPGDVHVDAFISGDKKAEGMVLSVQIDEGDVIDVSLTSSMIEKGFFSLDFSGLVEGVHSFKMEIKNTTNSTALEIHCVRLSGEIVYDAYVLRERWRPTTVFSSWKSRENSNDVQIFVMELSSKSELGHLSPITTKFGHFGPVFKPGGGALSMNMSLWSSSAGTPALPIEQQSHLLGIGSAKGEFYRYTHERRGVKVKGWDVFETNTSKNYVIALRFSNDGDFTTFYGYFWNEETNLWQLYSVGRKRALTPLKKLKTNAFIGVPGIPAKQRTNHRPREVRYRGWVCDSSGVWTELDRLIIPKEDSVNNHQRGITADGKYFYTSTGGLKNHLPNTKRSKLNKEKTEKLPMYMQKSKRRVLSRIPFVPRILDAYINEENVMKVRFKTKTPRESRVTICWGNRDAQSNEHNWDHSKTFTVPVGKKKKTHTHELTVSEDTNFVRLLVQDSEAQMWTFETVAVQKEE